MDKYLRKFVEFCKDYFKENLEAIVLYGSRTNRFHDDKSDYDVFIIIKEEVKKLEKDFRGKKNRNFKKVSIAYYETIPELIERLKKGSWASYIELNGTGKIVYKNKRFKRFLRKLKRYKPNKRVVAERFIEKKNKYEMKIMKKVKGEKLIKWLYKNIRKRLFLITHCKYNKSSFNFLKDLRKNKNIFSDEDYNLLKDLYNKYRKKVKKLSKKGKDDYFKLFKNLNKVIELLCNKNI